MRIAAIGRSLGVHLIMATQRPQGALTADIRANVTTSIALRVQSEMESMDIISTKAAAGISVDTPGRAYLARGTETPQEFQAASLGGQATEAEAEGIRIRLAIETLEPPAENGIPASDPAGVTPALAAAPLVTAMTELWAGMGGEPVRRPVAAPLPCNLPEPVIAEPALTAPAPAGALPSASPTAGTTSPWTIQLGLMDLPDEQRIAPVAWEPAGHGHLGLVGASESGVREALRFAVRALAAHSTESHLYLLDADSSFIGMAGHNRVGAHAGLHELRRAVRILERLAREQSQRLSRPALDDETPLILVIAGWGSWVSAFRSGPLAWAEDLVHDLVRDGCRAKLTVLLSGQRELVTARFFASVPNRAYFPTGSSEDSRLAWPKMPATPRVPGRAVAVGALSSDKAAVCQFYTPPRGSAEVGSAGGPQRHPIVRRPFRVDPLPAKVPAHEILARSARDAAAEATGAGVLGQPSGAVRHRHHHLRVGVGGDELAPVSLRLRAGGVLAVLGGPSSGKTNLLQLLPLLNGKTNLWLTPEAGADPNDYWSGILRKAVAGEVDRGSIALVDDADLLPAVANHGLTELNAMGFTVVVTAGFSPMVLQRVPLVLSARGLGTGLLIAPRTLMDGDLFGVRFDVEPNPPPGRSVLISDGRSMAVQLGWVNAELPAAPSGLGGAGHQRAKPQRAGGEPPVRDA